MNITSNTYANHFAFQRRIINVKKPTKQALINAGLTSVAGTASVVGGLSLGDTVFGPVSNNGDYYSVDAVSNENVIKSGEEWLTSAEEEGIPAQSTAAPSALVSSGMYLVKNGVEELDRKFPS